MIWNPFGASNADATAQTHLSDEEPIPLVDPTERLLNAKRAEILLQDPILAAAFEAVANRYRQTWENAPRGDLETQRTAHLCLAALKDVQGALRTYVNGGKLFEAIEQQRKAQRA